MDTHDAFTSVGLGVWVWMSETIPRYSLPPLNVHVLSKDVHGLANYISRLTLKSVTPSAAIRAIKGMPVPRHKSVAGIKVNINTTKHIISCRLSNQIVIFRIHVRNKNHLSSIIYHLPSINIYLSISSN